MKHYVSMRRAKNERWGKVLKGSIKRIMYKENYLDHDVEEIQ